MLRTLFRERLTISKHTKKSSHWSGKHRTIESSLYCTILTVKICIPCSRWPSFVFSTIVYHFYFASLPGLSFIFQNGSLHIARFLNILLQWCAISTLQMDGIPTSKVIFFPLFFVHFVATVVWLQLFSNSYTDLARQ